uniref:RE1-silencing transcription factor-like n=1 Tax=Labrus bergylta TaxID=56723 RepID=A0A3Q3GWL3_9LABR|nr:RE1-silencing transcription factor-like [Labrus bergylta]
MRPSWLPLAELSELSTKEKSETCRRMDYKLRVRKNRDWHKRLHLRRAAVQPPTMQSEDKHGPKKIAGERGQRKAWPSSKKPPREAQQRTKDSGHSLRFTCSQCGDNVEYVPKDLVRHFEEKHKGSLPVFPCHTCTFSTHEFSYLQVHLLSHKDTFSSCIVCNDNVQRTWPEFSAHLTTCHCKNGKFTCETCQKFSTADARVFLEHMYAHNLGQEGADGDIFLHRNDKNKALSCHQCGYEASHKWLITKHIKAVHVCQNGNQRRRKKEEGKEVHSIAMKPNDPPIPKMKPRLTRSAVREMCWLTEDCLSLPGKEFLDKYCHLSDPQTTMEETQQFLMKSVAGENGDQRWTKALKNVLSNVPQEMSLHSKSENGIMSNTADLTVLTVKNKITVDQNGAKYAKRLKLMSSDKEPVSLESAADDAHCVVDQKGCASNLNDSTPETKKDVEDVTMPPQNEPSECAQTQENRENQEVKTEEEKMKDVKKQEEHEEVVNTISKKSVEPTPIRKVVHKIKRRNNRWRRKRRCKKVDQESAALALKIVLKKNPVKEKQWVSQSSLSPSEDDPGLPSSHASSEETTTLLPEVHPKNMTKAPKNDLHDSSQAVISTSKSKPEEKLTPGCVGKPMGSKNMDRSAQIVADGLQHQVMPDDAEKSAETEVDRSGSAGRTAPDLCPESVQTSGGDMDGDAPGDETSSAADGVTSHSSYNKSSPEAQPAITPQVEVNSEDVSRALASEQAFEGKRDRDVPAESSPALHASRESSPDSQHRWQLASKSLERTLKLVAINPSQLVKRPAGDQPVVVLNHPDAEIPEVARIMEVVNRYRGEVQKVVLSRRTVNALSGANGDVTEADDCSDPAGLGKNAVQERFLLKMKFRRLSRKKYEVVDAASPGRDAVTKFSCWFCGRVFACQGTWMVHRQRHLIEWKQPNCEDS